MKPDATDKDVLRRAVAAVSGDLAGIGIEVDDRALPGGDAKARLTLDTGAAKSTFVVEVRRGILTPAALPTLETLARRSVDCGLLVVATQIGPTVAGLLRDRGIAFMDAAGNASLKTPWLHVWISGKRLRAIKPGGAGLHRQSAVKLVFALLTDPLLDAESDAALLNSAVRVLAKAAAVAMGSVGGVLESLRSRGFLLADDDARRLVERDRLIELWTTDFLARLRPRLVHHRYRIASAWTWERLPPLPPDALWGGEAAGARLTRHLRPEKITVYAYALPDEWVVRAGLQPDPDGNLEVLTPFWGDDLARRWQRAPIAQPADCVHPLLVYADLLADGEERKAETAKRIYDAHLQRIASPD